MPQTQTQTPTQTLSDHLKRHLAGPVLEALARPDVTDIHANPDGSLHLDTQDGHETTPDTLPPETTRAVLHLLADAEGDHLHPDKAFFATRLPPDPPFLRARLHAALPPVASAPCFAIRLHAPHTFELGDFTDSPQAAKRLLDHLLVPDPPNVLILGGTSTGKTSLANTLLHHVAEATPEERILCLEDVPELRVASKDHLCLRTESTAYDLETLVENALRLHPTRLVVGEVRGGEALGLIDAWSTGHRGGFATLHADDAHSGLLRLERLARRNRRAGAASLREDIAAAVDLVLELWRCNGGPRIVALHELSPTLTASGRYDLKPLT